MKIGFRSYWRAFPIGFTALVLALVALGIGFRLTHLDGHIYWHDEALTSLRMAGYQWHQVQAQVLNGQPISAADLQVYQQLNPAKGWPDVLQALTTNPQHPPFYYLMARLWAQTVGDSVMAMRLLPALLSLLALPGMVWLSRELFRSGFTGALAVALLAVSPLLVVYAQEARQYSLWAVTTLLSSAALLRAMRMQSRASWGLYALLLGLNFYTHLFAIPTAIGHGLYVIGLAKMRLTRTVRAYGVATGLSLLAFSPWLYLLAIYHGRVRQGAASAQVAASPEFLVKWWLRNLSHIFFYFKTDYSLWDVFDRADLLLLPLTLVLVIIALSVLCRTTPPRVWLFVLLLIGLNGLTLMLPDLLLGHRQSVMVRYFIPAALGIQLAIAHCLTHYLHPHHWPRHYFAPPLGHWRQRLWQGVTLLVITGGVASCLLLGSASAAWTKHTSYHYPDAAGIVNQGDRPLLVSDRFGLGHALSFSHVLQPDVYLQLGVDPQQFVLPPGFDPVFLINPSADLLDRFSPQQAAPDLVFQGYELWLRRLSP